MIKNCIFVVFGLLLHYSVVNAQESYVSAYQAGAYQPGIMNVRDLVAAESQGIIIIDYNYWNNSDGYYDRNGDKVSSLPE